MRTDFAPRFPFKVLHSIGDVNHGPIDTGCLQALIKQLTGGPHKWLSQLIFAITRLFAYEKYRGMSWPFAKYHLCRALVKIASVALLGRLAQAGEIVARRQERQGGPVTWVEQVHRSLMMQYLAAGTRQGPNHLRPLITTGSEE